ncbi:MAG: endo-1,4-beta-xylanase [Planctomycetes bacterium]|nr:endo-1,4-beta-xylanase [Planctomycetota bacterium]
MDMIRALLATALTLAAATVPAAEGFVSPALPAPAGEPFGSDPLALLTLTNSTARSAVCERLPAGADLPPGGALRVRLDGPATPGSMPWHIQLTAPSAAAMAKGTTLLVEFWMRTESSAAETGEGLAGVVLEEAQAPYAKAIEQEVAAPSDGAWVRVAAAGRAKSDYRTGRAQVNITLNSARSQALLIGGLRVLDLGPAVEPRDLPLPRITYEGREPDAPWRAAAQARIETLRKGDLAVRVVDAQGRPRAGVPVAVDMVRHAFPFGIAINGSWLVDPGADGERCRAWVRDNCSIVVLENDLKWGPWEWGLANDRQGPPAAGDHRHSRTRALAALRWLKDQGIAARGHCLVWPGWTYLPQRLRALAGDPARLAAEADGHITDILDATAPCGIVEWDVVNESWANRDLSGAIGPGALAGWFRLAAAHAPPGCRLFYNDYAHLRRAPGGEFRAFVEELVLGLKRDGAPIAGLGIQSHFGSSLPGPAAVLAELEAVHGRIGLPLGITEFDVNPAEQEDVQADFTRDFLTACFSSPAVSEFLMWGFWEGQHWLKPAALYRQDWSPKANARAWESLVRGAWWTRARAVTDADGVARVRGFKGLHRVTASVDGLALSTDAVIGERPAEALLGATVPAR